LIIVLTDRKIASQDILIMKRIGKSAGKIFFLFLFSGIYYIVAGFHIPLKRHEKSTEYF